MILGNKGRSSKDVLTLYGKITFDRTMLVPVDKTSADALLKYNGAKSVCPVDDLLGISDLPFKMTYRMMAAIAKEATYARSFTDAAERIRERFGEEISVSTIQNVTEFVGNWMFTEQYCQAIRAQASAGEKVDGRTIHKRKDDVLYIETDGAMVFVRDKNTSVIDGITGKTKTAPSDSGTENVPGWTESKHAICFHADDIKYYYEDKAEKKHTARFKELLKLDRSKIEITGTRIERRDCIGYIGPADEFQYHLLALARRNNWEHCTKVVLLSDGAKWIKGIKDTVLSGRPVIQILDLYHAKENAGKFANYVKHSEKQRKEYADHLCDLIEQGSTDKLLEELKEYENEKMPDNVPNLYTYIDNNKPFMDYPAYRKAGLFVGSGAMESANIYMMQDRMKLPGMRWNKKRGQHILTLKSYMAARNWDEVEAQLYDCCYGHSWMKSE